ncbi:hypothetical protein [Methanobrevibacter sp.]|uniref:hypothetical protein n=1 Tax=Methanobrevibacter sp. TaxID=66852 RepID=UPI00388E3B18
MDYEAFKIRSVIFANHFKIDKKPIFFESGNFNYKFLILDFGHNALDISSFSRYSDIISSSGPIEKKLDRLIGSTSTNSSVLKSTALKRKRYLLDEKITVNINGQDYFFKIDGIGPQAIKITTQITYDEITTSDKPVESTLRDLIYTLYRGQLNNKLTLEKIEAEWQSKEAHNHKVHEEVLREERERELKKKKVMEELGLSDSPNPIKGDKIRW